MAHDPGILRPPPRDPRLWIGPAGFSYPDWKGRVYPASAGPSFDPLEWISRFFDLVEINASFYRIPPEERARRWIERIGDDPRFRFTVKLHRSFTHEEHEIRPASLSAFLDFLAPLHEAGRLGPLLAQFPWSFRSTFDHHRYLARLAEAFAPHRLAVEVRHGSWGRPNTAPDWQELGVHPVSIDQPQVGDSLPPKLQVDHELLYLRMHGRNEAAWFSRSAGRDQRYDYRYSLEELRPWADALRKKASSGAERYVITNNHFQGQAVVNALQVRALLGEDVKRFPRWLEEEFPEIRRQLRQAGAVDPRPHPPEESDTARTARRQGNGQGDLFE